MGEWRPIETAPKPEPGGRIIVTWDGNVGEGRYFASFYEESAGWRPTEGWVPFYSGRVTHWMPYPKPPADDVSAAGSRRT